MFRNRFLSGLSVLSVLLLAAAVSVSFAMDPTAGESGWPPRSVIVPVTGANALPDDYQRRSERNTSAVNSVKASDYFTRHPELRGRLATSVVPALQGSAIDECFDVSISELAGCREASQLASQ